MKMVTLKLFQSSSDNCDQAKRYLLKMQIILLLIIMFSRTIWGFKCSASVSSKLGIFKEPNTIDDNN